MRKPIIVVFSFFFALLISSAVSAEEPLEKYLEGLKQRGFFDVAYEYLDIATKNGTIPPTLRDRIDYEKAVVLFDGLREIRDRKQAEKNIDLAQNLLTKFITEKKFHPFAALARNQLGNLLIRRAQLAVEKADDEETAEDAANELRTKARGYYIEAGKVLELSRTEIKQALERIDPKNKDPQIIELRDRYREKFLRVRLLLGLVEEESANTYLQGSKERTELLEKAIAIYDDYAKDYRARLVGMRALLFQARCLSKLDKFDDASVLINEILKQPNNPLFLPLKRDASLLGAKTWFSSEPPKYRTAITLMKPLVDSVPPNSRRKPEWLEVQLYLARAYNLYAQQLKTKKELSKKEREELAFSRNRAAELAKTVARYPGPKKEEAQLLLVEIGSRKKIIAEEVKPPRTFVEARDRAVELLADYESDLVAVETLQDQVDTAADDKKKELESQLKETQASLVTGPQEALDLLRTAMQLVDNETPRIDREQAHARIGYCYNLTSKHEEAATIGEFMVDAFPNSAATRSAGNIAIASLWDIHKQLGKSADRTTEESKLRKISTHIIDTWPSECATAAATMIQLSLTGKDVASAEKYLGMLPPDADGRPTLAMTTGFVIWSDYKNKQVALKKAIKEGRETVSSAKPKFENLNAIKSRAEKYLSEGLPGITEPISLNAARAGLGLARLYTENNETDKAIAIFENETFGPLKLANTNHPVKQAVSTFGMNTYRTALQCYVSRLASGKDVEATNEKASAAMAGLKSSLKTHPKGEALIVGIYVSLAQGLMSEMETLAPEKQKQYASGLGTFLEQVRTESKDISALVWVADTYKGLSETFAKNNDAATAKTYETASAKVYETILTISKTNPEAMTPAVKYEMTRRFAKQKSEAGQFDEAKDLYLELLSQKSSVIDVQMEVSQMYQQWGAAKKDPNLFARAMMGAEPRENPKTKKKQNLVWGWGRISQVVVKYPKYRGKFFEAKFNEAKCLTEYAKLLGPKKDRYMAMAERSILMTYKVDDSLGGKNWQSKFDTLLRSIQKELGKSASGISGLK